MIPDADLFTFVCAEGNLYYFKDNNKAIFHRDFGPAIIANNDMKYWFKHNKKHRTNGIAEPSLFSRHYHLHGMGFFKHKYMSIVL